MKTFRPLRSSVCLSGIACLAIACLAIACGSPTAPTPDAVAAAKTKADVAPVVPVAAAPVPVPPAAPSTEPVYTVSDGFPCTETTSPHGLYAQTVTVADSGPNPLHVIALAFHDATAGCESTEAGPRPAFQVSGKSNYLAHESGTLRLTYDTREYDCGRVQLDASFVDSTGRSILIVGYVVNYGADCKPSPKPVPVPTPPPPPVPTPPPPPVPTPAPPPVPTVCAAVASGSITGITTANGITTSTAIVMAGPSAIVASYVSYQAPSATGDGFPQALYDQSTLTIAAGSTATFTIRLPSCFYQVDLVCGPPIVNLTGALYGDLKLDSRFGGTEACR
jgi:hypothetical protein